MSVISTVRVKKLKSGSLNDLLLPKRFKEQGEIQEKEQGRRHFLKVSCWVFCGLPGWVPDKVGMTTPHFAVESLRPSLRVKHCVGGPPPLGWGVLFNLLASHIFCFPIMTECFWCKFCDYSQHCYCLWS